MTELALKIIVLAVAILPLGAVIADSFRSQHDRRHLLLSIAYAVFALNECVFLFYGRPYYLLHTFITGIIVPLGFILFIAEQKEKLIFPTTFIFHLAFLYLGIFGITGLAVITPAKADVLLQALSVLVALFGLLVIIQSRCRTDLFFWALLLLWAGAGIGRYQQPPLFNLVLNAAFFSLLCVRILTVVNRANRRMLAENHLLFKSRDMVLSMLNDIAASPELISSVERTLHRVLETVQESLSVEGTALYRWDGDTLKYYVSTGTFYPLTPEDEFTLNNPPILKDHLEKSSFKKGDGVIGIVAETLEPLVLDRSLHYQRMMMLGLNTRVMRNLLAVPFRTRGELFGVIAIQNSRSQATFGEEDRHLLEALADQAAISVNNTEMYSKVGQTERLRQEANIANRIQKQLLPTSVPVSPNLSIAAFIEPAKEVGGDYYDFIRHDDKSLGLAIGDVSGKGVPAGMIMAIAKVIVQIVARGSQDCSEIVIRFCREIFPYMQRGQFMTLNYLRWVDETRTLFFAAAGHEHLLWFHAASGQVDKIRAGGLAAGLVEDAAPFIKQTQLQMAQGDIMVLYTDGVTEANNSSKEMFTLRRLQASLESNAYLADAEKIRDQIIRDVREFMGGAEQFDDITLMVLAVG